MPRRKAGEESTRNIQRSGGTYTVSLPIGLVRELGWREHQKVTVTRSGKTLRIVDWKPGKKK